MPVISAMCTVFLCFVDIDNKGETILMAQFTATCVYLDTVLLFCLLDLVIQIDFLHAVGFALIFKFYLATIIFLLLFSAARLHSIS